MNLRRRSSGDHHRDSTTRSTTTSPTTTGNNGISTQNPRGRTVRFAMDPPLEEVDDDDDDDDEKNQYQQRPRRVSFSWKSLRRNSAPAVPNSAAGSVTVSTAAATTATRNSTRTTDTPAIASTKPVLTVKDSQHGQHVNLFLAATEIERILRDDVHSRDFDQVRVDDDDDDENDENDDDSDENDDNDETATTTSVPITTTTPLLVSQTSMVRRPWTVASSIRQRVSTMSRRTLPTSPMSTATPTYTISTTDATSTILTTSLRPPYQQEQEQQQLRQDYLYSDENDEELTEHHVNAYNLFDSAGADEARMRLFQRRQRRRQEQTQQHHSNNINNPNANNKASLLSWIIPTSTPLPSSSSSSWYSHENDRFNDSAIIYSGKYYDLSLVRHLLTLLMGLFGTLVVIQVISQLSVLFLLISIHGRGWIVLEVLVVGLILLQLWQVVGKLCQGLWTRIQLSIPQLRFVGWVRPDRRNSRRPSTTINLKNQSNHRQFPFCTICLEAYCDNEDECSSLFQKQYLVFCKHSFHYHCIQQWLEINDSCPICRIPASFESNQRHHPQLQEDRFSHPRRGSGSGRHRDGTGRGDRGDGG